MLKELLYFEHTPRCAKTLKRLKATLLSSVEIDLMGSHIYSQQYQEMQNSHLISLIVSCFPGNCNLSLVVLKLA